MVVLVDANEFINVGDAVGTCYRTTEPRGDLPIEHFYN